MNHLFMPITFRIADSYTPGEHKELTQREIEVYITKLKIKDTSGGTEQILRKHTN